MIFLFDTTREAIAAESACREEGIKFRIVPVPREISSRCGMSLETEMESEVEKKLSEKKIKFSKFYPDDSRSK